MATSSHGFRHGGIDRRLLSSESAFMALNISMATSTESDSVVALTFPAEK